jgi:hypothetical protein
VLKNYFDHQGLHLPERKQRVAWLWKLRRHFEAARTCVTHNPFFGRSPPEVTIKKPTARERKLLNIERNQIKHQLAAEQQMRIRTYQSGMLPMFGPKKKKDTDISSVKLLEALRRSVAKGKQLSKAHAECSKTARVVAQERRGKALKEELRAEKMRRTIEMR